METRKTRTLNRSYNRRSDPSLTYKHDLARLITMEPSALSYRIRMGDIPDGDVMYQSRRLYSPKLVAKLVQQWKGIV